MQVYSPTQTRSFLKCPTYRMLDREGWEDPYAGKKRIAGCIGTAVAAGLEEWNKSRQYGRQRKGVISFTHALNTLEAELTQLERMVLDDAMVAKAPALVVDALNYYAETDPIPSDWTILGAEVELPDSGRSRPDLLVWDRHGAAVVDFKCKIQLYGANKEQRDRTKEKILSEYEKDWQMFHYCHFASLMYGRPIRRYYICLITLTPKVTIDLVAYQFSQKDMENWEWSAEATWQSMRAWDDTYAVQGGEEANAIMPMAAVHHDQYGRCSFFDACFTYNLDREALAQQYIQIKRRRKECDTSQSAM